jgi:integrase
VYLTDTALELIGDTTGKGFIFPTPHKAMERSIDDHALAVAVLRNLALPLVDGKGKPVTENRFGIAKFTPHDLRRTAATFMAESGEMDEVIDAIMNHAKQGVIKVYSQLKYDKQKQAALESWARKLEAITTGSEGAQGATDDPQGKMNIACISTGNSIIDLIHKKGIFYDLDCYAFK